MKKKIAIISLLVLMAGFGFGVNRYIAAQKRDPAAPPTNPTQEVPAFSLPGTIYVAQQGQLYSFRAGHFGQIAEPTKDFDGEPIDWQDPVPLPNGTLIVVKRGFEYSDFYNIDQTGKVLSQMTQNYRGNDPNTIRSDHWVYWPILAPDGVTLYYSVDSPKDGYTYEVDFNVWSTVITGGPITVQNSTPNGVIRGTRWTIPNYYTGGDTDPMPLRAGGLLYVEYAIGGDGKVFAQLGLVASPLGRTKALTTPDQNCNAAVLSPDQTHVAMICTADHQTTQLEVATFDGTTLGTPSVLVSGCLCASPQWSPDGQSLIYLAPPAPPNDALGHFQLWWLDKAAALTHAAPKQVTATLDLDATSVPAWTARTS